MEGGDARMRGNEEEDASTQVLEHNHAISKSTNCRGIRLA